MNHNNFSGWFYVTEKGTVTLSVYVSWWKVTTKWDKHGKEFVDKSS